MAYSRDRYLRRQKTCLVLSIFLLILGILQLCLGGLFAVSGRKCDQVKSMLIGVYLVIAGVSGIANYWPPSPCKAKKAIRSRGMTAVLGIFCALVSLSVIFDNRALNCVGAHDDNSKEAPSRMYAVLGLMEVTGMQLAHLLSALCAGLACPDLWSPKTAWTHKPDKILKSGTKNKALHLPEAKTHVQEAAGTGDRVTVVSLPETEGIVYAVPEDQYVIRQGEATYIAPPGNTNLTPFFPTYRIQMD